CMSGTSLDGIDLALCSFWLEDRNWRFEILKARTYAYDDFWYEKLTSAAQLSDSDLQQFDDEFGRFIGTRVREFCLEADARPDFISSHGHTVKHDPRNGVTIQ